MGKLIGVTFPIIAERIGEGAKKYGREVKRINQLLKLAGYLNALPTDPKTWTKASKEAILAFHKRCQVGPVEPYIDPKDDYDRLFTLALSAGVLIPLPFGLRSKSAAEALFKHCRAARYKYGWVKGTTVYNGGTRMIWGFEGRPAWAIATLLPKDDCGFAEEIPVSLNCTSFANLMLSAWYQGNAHAKPYDCSQMVGGYDPLGARYNLHPVNDGRLIFDGYSFDPEAVVKAAQPNRMYYLGLCQNDSGQITHDVVLIDGEIYEINIPPNNPAVYSTKAYDRLVSLMGKSASKGCAYMMGPTPC